MGFRCERCKHEWLPKSSSGKEPRVCPACKTPYWNEPKKMTMTYEQFRDKIEKTIRDAGSPLTWTEIRTTAGLYQLFPNNGWVHRMEKDIGLIRKRDAHGIIHWGL
jgi:hypothetical protein